jgi:hypothetical protein
MLQKVREIALVKSDFLGMSASFLCIIHCLAAPVLISFGSVFNFYAHNHLWDYVFMAMAFIAVWTTAKNTQSQPIKWALWIAVFSFSISLMLHDWVDWMRWFSLGSSLVLVVLHFLNWKFHLKVR